MKKRRIILCGIILVAFASYAIMAYDQSQPVLNWVNLGLVGSTINVSNITFSLNCVDGEILKWSSGVGTCGTDLGVLASDFTTNNGSIYTSIGLRWLLTDAQTNNNSIYTTINTKLTTTDHTTQNTTNYATFLKTTDHTTNNNSIYTTINTKLTTTDHTTQNTTNYATFLKTTDHTTNNNSIYTTINTKLTTTDHTTNNNSIYTAINAKLTTTIHTTQNTTNYATFLKTTDHTTNNNSIYTTINTKLTTIKTIISGRGSATITADEYYHPTGGVLIATDTDPSQLMKLPYAGTIHNLTHIMSAAQGSGDTCNLYVKYAETFQANTSLTSLVAGIVDVDTETTDSTNSVQVAAGSYIKIFFDEAAGSCSGFPSWSFIYEHT